ncbi:hypothetical protein [Rhodoflexus caldus]|uniref:hypothetical protein n=1 Tax=Rhodoflexus caldus TaxID=2891236 RepID=UPI00202A9D45|nr:hypothetical protein [Rhodoflexus caldus]
MKYVLVKSFFVWMICGLLAAPQLWAQDATDTDTLYQSFGKIYRLQLINAPFPSPERANGHTYNGKTYSAAEHYNDSTVLVFIPKKFNPSREVDVVVYFHGWYNNPDSALVQFNLINQFVQANKNAILIVPQGPKNAPDSFGGKLEKAGMFAAFINETFLKLAAEKVFRSNPRLGTIVIAGHSGAYRVMAHILMHGGMEIKEVYLFDGLYSQFEKFILWIDRNKTGRFVAVTSPAEGGTEKQSMDMMAVMKAWKIPFASFKELDASLVEMEKNRVVFIQSILGHNEVLSTGNNLYKCLVTSGNLKDIN